MWLKRRKSRQSQCTFMQMFEMWTLQTTLQIFCATWSDTAPPSVLPEWVPPLGNLLYVLRLWLGSAADILALFTPLIHMQNCLQSATAVHQVRPGQRLNECYREAQGLLSQAVSFLSFPEREQSGEPNKQRNTVNQEGQRAIKKQETWVCGKM